MLAKARQEDKQFFYGGQAVIEGVLMRGPKHWACAVRKADGNIILKKAPLKASIYTSKWCTKPFLRGVVGLAEMMHLGSAAIKWSAQIQMEGLKSNEGAKPVSEATRKRRMKWVSFFGLLLGIVVAISLFILTPLWVGAKIAGHARGVGFAVDEGLVRLVFLIGYLAIINKLPGIYRLFSYHGSEHKSINCLESGKELTVANVKQASKLHPRCGTGLIIVVAMISILLFAPLSFLPVPFLIASRLLLLPLVASVSYECVRVLAAYKETRVGKILLLPVLNAQRLTTNEPDDSMIEVALVALNACINSESIHGESTELILTNEGQLGYSAKNGAEAELVLPVASSLALFNLL